MTDIRNCLICSNSLFSAPSTDCQGTGEFIISKATLNDYNYDFEAHARFWRFEKTGIRYSFNTGFAMKQDVTVQLTISEQIYSYSNMFEDLPVNFYVDGVPRLLSQGSRRPLRSKCAFSRGDPATRYLSGSFRPPPFTPFSI